MYRNYFTRPNLFPNYTPEVRRWPTYLLLSLLVVGSFCAAVQAQSGTQTLYGDFKVDDTRGEALAKPISYDLILYSDTGVIAARQTISNGGRYRFVNMPIGIYFLAV